MVDVFTIHHSFAPLLLSGLALLIIGPLVPGMIWPARRRSRAVARIGRKVPPPAGRHLDTQPIPITPVTAMEGIPLRGLLVPAPGTRIMSAEFDELVAGKSPFVPLEPSTGPVYLQMSGRGRRRRVA